MLLSKVTYGLHVYTTGSALYQELLTAQNRKSQKQRSGRSDHFPLLLLDRPFQPIVVSSVKAIQHCRLLISNLRWRLISVTS